MSSHTFHRPRGSPKGQGMHRPLSCGPVFPRALVSENGLVWHCSLHVYPMRCCVVFAVGLLSQYSGDSDPAILPAPPSTGLVCPTQNTLPWSNVSDLLLEEAEGLLGLQWNQGQCHSTGAGGSVLSRRWG